MASPVGWSDDHLWSRRFLWLKMASAGYVLAVPLTHYALPHGWIWHIAFGFLLAMLVTYPVAARLQRRAVPLETAVSLGLAGLGLLGLLTTPWLLVVAIFGHGLWDLAKHLGAGCGFFRWYLLGCLAVDWAYAGALATVLLTGSAASAPPGFL